MGKAWYIGDQTNKARKCKKMYIGDENNKARKIKKIYIGDENNKARLCWSGGDKSTILMIGQYKTQFNDLSTITMLYSKDGGNNFEYSFLPNYGYVNDFMSWYNDDGTIYVPVKKTGSFTVLKTSNFKDWSEVFEISNSEYGFMLGIFSIAKHENYICCHLGHTFILSSDDGKTFTEITPRTTVNSQTSNMVWFKDRFICFSKSINGMISIKTDGTYKITTLEDDTRCNSNSIAISNDTLVAVPSASITNPNYFYYSKDGENITKVTPSLWEFIATKTDAGVTYWENENKFIISGKEGVFLFDPVTYEITRRNYIPFDNNNYKYGIVSVGNKIFIPREYENKCYKTEGFFGTTIPEEETFNTTLQPYSFPNSSAHGTGMHVRACMSV